jgi:hypothetical protein
MTAHLGGRLRPDHYQGAAVIRPTGKADQVVVPFTLDVRAGPELPVLVLLGSVFAGWLIGRIFGLAPKRDFSTSAELLRVRINGLPTSERALLTPLFDDTWALRGEDLPLAQTQADSLSAAVRALRRAREIQDPVFNDPGNLPFAPWLQRIGGATAALHTAIRAYAPAFDDRVAAITAQVEALGAARAAEAEVAELTARAEAAKGQLAYAEFAKAARIVRTAIEAVPPDPSEPAPALEPLLAVMRRAFAALEQAHGPLPLPEAVPGTVAPSGVGDTVVAAVGALGWPVGGAAMEAGAAFDAVTSLARVALPFASWLVAVVLLAVGFKLTYLDESTFGATAGDWLALVIWGLAAWGARQTLTGLGPPASKE